MSRDVSRLAVGRIERLIALRSFPIYSQMPAQTVMRIGARMDERFYKKGEYLAREGEPSAYLHFIVRGKVELRRHGKVLRRLGDLSVAGGIAALAEDPHGYDIEALEDTSTLRTSAEDGWDNFEDHFDLLKGLIQRLSTEIFELRRELPGLGFNPTDWTPGDHPTPRELDLIGRMASLRKVLAFAGSNVEALADLAREIEEVRFQEPTRLWERGDPGSHFFLVRHGVVRGEFEGTTLRFGPTDTTGSLEAMANLPRWYTAETEGPFVGLRIERNAIFDVLEDHFQFARRMTSALAGFMLQLMERNALELK